MGIVFCLGNIFRDLWISRRDLMTLVFLALALGILTQTRASLFHWRQRMTIMVITMPWSTWAQVIWMLWSPLRYRMQWNWKWEAFDLCRESKWQGYNSSNWANFGFGFDSSRADAVFTLPGCIYGCIEWKPHLQCNGKVKVTMSGKIDLWHVDVLISDDATPSSNLTVGYDQN
jgi:hypothetical protein